MKLTPKEYREIYKKLPPELFDVANSGDTTEHIYNICEKHKLHIDESGIVHDIVMDVVMGIIPARNMINEIIKEIKLAPLTASALVRDIDDEILSPIKDIMLKIYQNSNPFKPKTLKFIDESDEEAEDDVHLRRDSLLQEIENPETLHKTEPIKEIKPEEKPEKPIVIKEPEIPQEIKEKRDKLLTKIGGASLSNLITMADHMKDGLAKVKKEGMINEVQTPNLYKVINNEEPMQNKTLVDPFRSGKIEDKKETLKQTPTVTQNKIIDPYREAI